MYACFLFSASTLYSTLKYKLCLSIFYDFELFQVFWLCRVFFSMFHFLESGSLFYNVDLDKSQVSVVIITES